MTFCDFCNFFWKKKNFLVKHSGINNLILIILYRVEVYILSKNEDR